MMDLHSLPSDHIDLILTAAIDFKVISAPPGTPRPQQLLTAMAQRLGTHLQLRNQHPDMDGYRYRPVEGVLDVRDVLKACHAAQHAYRDTKLWTGSNEQRVVDAVAKAASMRTPGYELSPWLWKRPAEWAIGYAPDGGQPEVSDVTWITDLDDFTARWPHAHLVILTREALEQLPAMPARPRVFIITEAADAAAAFREATASRLKIENILLWPDAKTWLSKQLVA